jgi:polysaccharide biosynthesis transport protein
VNDRNSLPTLGQVSLPGENTALDPAVLLRSARKHWVLILFMIVLGAGGSVAYTATRIPIYEAVATVQLDPQPLMPLGHRITPGGNDNGADAFWSNQEYFQTQQQIITSRRIASLVVKKLGLNNDAAFLANRPTSKGLTPAKATVDGTAELLRARLSVNPVKDSRLTQVTLRDSDPERAQRLLSTLLEVYVDQNLDSSLDSANKTADWLDTQLEKLKTDLESQEMELHDFKKRNNLLSVSFDDQSNMLRNQILQLNTKLTELKAHREHVSARLQVLNSVDPQDPAVIPQSELFGSTALLPLRDKYQEAVTSLSRLTSLGKGDNHPEVQFARLEVDRTREALLGEIKNIRQGVSNDLTAVQGELAGVSSLYETAKQQALGLNLNELRYSRLRRSKDNTERVFGMVLERSSESGLSKLMPFNNVRVLDRPLKPGGPVLPRPFLNFFVGSALGALLGLVGAIARELLDRTVRNVEEVEQELGLTSVGTLPDATAKSGSGVLYGAYYGTGNPKKKRKKGEPDATDPAPGAPMEMLVHTHPKSAVSEAARAICTNLLFMSPDRPFGSMLVTSAGPAEGKTTIAISIAIALAQTGRKVCLVDCDLRRPRIHNLFGRTLEQGLTTALLDPAQLETVAAPSSVPNLCVLPAGPMPPNPADLMHSQAFARLFAALKERFDEVIIDSPPVCVVTDATILSTQTEAVVLVVRAHRTRRDQARRALRTLRDVGARVAGFVMNATPLHGGSYGAYGGYGYGYYHKEEPEKTAEAS